MGNEPLIDKLFNTKISVAKVIFLLYLILASNLATNLMSRQLKEYIETSRIAQHFIGFTLVLSIINLLGGDLKLMTSLTYTLLAYLWFLLSTKIDLIWNFIFIGLLYVDYFIENYLDDIQRTVEEDETLTQSHKESKKIERNRKKTIILIGIIILSVWGWYQYYSKKKVQLGGNFNTYDYFLKQSEQI